MRFAEESIDDDSLGVTVIIATASKYTILCSEFKSNYSCLDADIFAVIIPVIAYVTLFISFVASLATYRYIVTYYYVWVISLAILAIRYLLFGHLYLTGIKLKTHT